MEKKIEELKVQLQEIVNRQFEITNKAEAEKRDLTNEESKELDELQESFDAVKHRIGQLERQLEQQDSITKPASRKSEGEQPGAGDQTVNGDQQALNRPERKPDIIPGTYAVPLKKDGGFRTLGEMAFHVANHVLSNRSRLDNRLEQLASATTYGSEGVGADGGFAVPPDFRSAIMQKVMAEDSLLSLCDQMTVDGNSLTIPKDETTPWQTSGGILAYWDGEADAATQSKPQLEQTTVRLNKLRCLVPMTEESMEDAGALDSYLRRKAPEKIAFKVNLAILQGNGVGQPLGLLTAPATISVAKVTSQDTDSFVVDNVIDMFSRLYAPQRSNAVWVLHQDLEPWIFKFSRPGKDATGTDTSNYGTDLSHVITYTPDGQFRIFGKRVIFSQACETLGDKGDAFFADFSQYLAVLKSGPNPRTEVSMHLWFDQDLLAFKFILRMGGVPWWSSSISARDGSNTYSSYVTLDERG